MLQTKEIMKKPNKDCLHSMQDWYIKDNILGCHDCDYTKKYNDFFDMLKNYYVADERLNVFFDIFNLYCQYCGIELKDKKCYCKRDD